MLLTSFLEYLSLVIPLESFQFLSFNVTRVITRADHKDSSVHKWESFINTTFSPTLILFAFNTNYDII